MKIIHKRIRGILIFIVFVFLNLLYAQNLQIINHYPHTYSHIDTSFQEIYIKFSTGIDTNNLKGNIRLLSSYTALVDYNYAVNASEVFIFPKKKFKEGEEINVIVTSNLQGSAGESFDGYQWIFNIKPSKQTFPYFTQPVIYPQYYGYGIISADFNRDGNIDIILDSGQCLINDGIGNFLLHQDITTGSGMAWNITDLDYDGYPELMTGVGVYELGCDGFFYLDNTLHDLDYDYNNDGILDRIIKGTILPGDTTNYLGIIYSDLSGGFLVGIDTLVIDKNIVGWLSSKDFNNDGIRDIAYMTNVFATPYGVGGENKLVVLYRNLSGDTINSFVVHNHQFYGGGLGFLFQIMSADFNNDKFQDILLVTNLEDLIVFNDTLGGFLTGHNDYQIPGGGDLKHVAHISDITGDGWFDLIYNYVIGVNENASTSFMRNDSGVFNFGQYIYDKEWADVYYSTSADFNGDGAMDIATTWFDGLYIHFNTDVNRINKNINISPQNFNVYNNFPNPFNSETVIEFDILTPVLLEIKIFNINGKKVKEYQKKTYRPGNYSLIWDGKNNSGKGVSSGTYYWRFDSEKLSKTIKVLLLK